MAAHAIRNEDCRASALSALAPQLTGDLLAEALADTRKSKISAVGQGFCLPGPAPYVCNAAAGVGSVWRRRWRRHAPSRAETANGQPRCLPWLRSSPAKRSGR